MLAQFRMVYKISRMRVIVLVLTLNERRMTVDFDVATT